MASFRRDIAGSANGDMKVWTYSVWFKRAKLGQLQFLLSWGENNGSECKCYITADDKLLFMNDGVNGSSNTTTRVLRDTNSWYHLVWRHKADEASNDDRWKIYLNGELIPASEYGSPTLLNADGSGQRYTSLDNWIGENARNQQGSGIYPFYGCMSHIHLCDGYAYDASDFGETDSTTGEWKIKTEPNVSYGTYGYFIAKDGNSGTDQSPNTNNATVSGTITKTEDNPSNVFCTWNRLTKGSYIDFNYGNTNVYGNTVTNNGNTWGTISFPPSGKYYWETKVISYHANASSGYPQIGIIRDNTISQGDMNGGTGGYVSSSNDCYYPAGGTTIYSKNGNVTVSATSLNDIIMCAMDSTAGNMKFWMGVNGTWFNSGDPANGTNAIWTETGDYQPVPFMSGYNGSRGDTNFGNGYFGTTAVSSAGTNASGNGIFEYDVPTGFTALSTKGMNL